MMSAEVSSTKTFVSVFSGAKRLTLPESSDRQSKPTIGLRFTRTMASASLHEITGRVSVLDSRFRYGAGSASDWSAPIQCPSAERDPRQSPRCEH